MKLFQKDPPPVDSVLPIGEKQVNEAYNILLSYKKGKQNLERRVIENEQWYKLRHWDQMRKQSPTEVEPASAWLFNCIENKHADAMDNIPTVSVLPREAGDEKAAKLLGSVLPVVLEQNDFESAYAAVWQDMLKGGTGIYGVFWDGQKCDGLGDVSIVPMDILSVFWEPGVTDIQKSRHFFSVELVDNDLLEQRYPALSGKLKSSQSEVAHYLYDDSVDTSCKSTVVDWYYKKWQGGRQVLHYCKFVGETVLFATENLPADRFDASVNGWYHHGQYPFVFFPLFTVKGTPAGLGYIDIGKNPQEYVDRGNQAILKNLLFNAKPRFFVRGDSSVDPADYADTANEIIRVDGNLGTDSIMPVPTTGLSGIYLQVLNQKIDELKETTGNRDIATGGTSSGVTAASAIAAMQEAGSKLSRNHIRGGYRAFRKVCLQVIGLIQQFYDLPRSFRVLGEQGVQQYLQFCAHDLKREGRSPLFDLQVTAVKQSPYSRMSQNELALQFYSAGFFNPQFADQALACLSMMDFDRKEFVERTIGQNRNHFAKMDRLEQQVLALWEQLDQLQSTDRKAQAAAVLSETLPMPPKVKGKTDSSNNLVTKARQRVADATAPR